MNRLFKDTEEFAEWFESRTNLPISSPEGVSAHQRFEAGELVIVRPKLNGVNWSAKLNTWGSIF